MPSTAGRESEAASQLDHVGLIAGEGKFPFLLAMAARDRKIAVSAIGVKGITSPALAESVDAMYWVQFGQFNRMIETLHEAGVTKCFLAGRIKHQSIFQLSKLDRRGISLLARTGCRKADSILGAVTDEFARENIEVLESTILMQECMPAPGLLTPQCPPSKEVSEDIEFGRPIAQSLAGLDVGQTIVVKQKSIVAVEAMEGTDQTILRAGEFAGEGCVVIKIDKPMQDRRFDVPVVGLTTVKKLIQTRCSALAIPGDSALFFDREEACALAASRGITLLAW